MVGLFGVYGFNELHIGTSIMRRGFGACLWHIVMDV